MFRCFIQGILEHVDKRIHVGFGPHYKFYFFRVDGPCSSKYLTALSANVAMGSAPVPVPKAGMATEDKFSSLQILKTFLRAV